MCHVTYAAMTRQVCVKYSAGAWLCHEGRWPPKSRAPCCSDPEEEGVGFAAAETTILTRVRAPLLSPSSRFGKERPATETLSAGSASRKEWPIRRAESRLPSSATGPPETRGIQCEGPRGTSRCPGPPASWRDPPRSTGGPAVRLDDRGPAEEEELRPRVGNRAASPPLQRPARQPMDTINTSRTLDVTGEDEGGGILPPGPEKESTTHYDTNTCQGGRDPERLARSHDNRGQVLHAVAVCTQLSERDKSKSPLKPTIVSP
ncbi:hypothetical protein NDU88_005438 [Pleurodeles waltl]|uniref:Uncharacterized protein n=1 Tax=Pleurodeles waltl TaxID=8319 RepID=A0AAV7VN80_PLEWA|nr:hypothetical protein NDU88_005438 [Pleurodeles waltl]